MTASGNKQEMISEPAAVWAYDPEAARINGTTLLAVSHGEATVRLAVADTGRREAGEGWLRRRGQIEFTGVTSVTTPERMVRAAERLEEHLEGLLVGWSRTSRGADFSILRASDGLQLTMPCQFEVQCARVEVSLGVDWPATLRPW